MEIKINSVHFKADGKLETLIKDGLQKMYNLFEGIIGSEVILNLKIRKQGIIRWLR